MNFPITCWVLPANSRSTLHLGCMFDLLCLPISLTGRILWHYMNKSDTTTRQETSGDWERAAQLQVQWQKRRLENDYIYCGLCRARWLRLPCRLHQTISHKLVKRLANWEKQQEKFPLKCSSRSDMLLAEPWLQSEPGPCGQTQCKKGMGCTRRRCQSEQDWQ